MGFFFAMLLGIIMMSGILLAEFLIEGQKNGRLVWPYGDTVPGSYLAKFGLPIVVLLTCYIFQERSRHSTAAATVIGITLFVCFLTGERVHVVTIICAVLLTTLLTARLSSRTLILMTCFVSTLALASIVDLQSGPSRIFQLYNEILGFHQGDHFNVIKGGIEAFRTQPLIGIGPANYRLMAPEILQGQAFIRPDNHPHNYYIQLLAETGVIGAMCGTLLVVAITFTAYRRSRLLGQMSNLRAMWVVPLATFWPLATHSDFFGQWMNIFVWTAVGTSLGILYSLDDKTSG